MKLEVFDTEQREIEAAIASDQSPVGIDAKKTHVIIIQKLMKIEERLSRLEAAMSRTGSD